MLPVSPSLCWVVLVALTRIVFRDRKRLIHVVPFAYGVRQFRHAPPARPAVVNSQSS